MAQHIVVTEDLLFKLNKEQQDHTAKLLADPYNRFGDDWGDDTEAALTLSTILFHMVWDEAAVQDLDVWLNTPYDENATTVDLPTLGTVEALAFAGGCDGYCPALYDLDCPALPKDRD